MEHALARLHVVVESLGHEGRVGEEARQPIGHLRERARQRLRFEDRAAFGAELIERIGHRFLLFLVFSPFAVSRHRNVQIVGAGPRREYHIRHRQRHGRDREEVMRKLGMLRVIAILLASSSALWSDASRAEEPFPARTVRIVVPSAPGSTTDTLARIVADRLGRTWAKAVIVENIAGGAMNPGATNVARAAPDGHVLMVAPPAPLAFNDLLYRDLLYRPSQFVPITLLAKIPNILVVRKDLPAASLKDLIALAKADPGKLSYASQGVGSTAHLSASQLEALAAIKMVHVPYRGAQPALTDVMAGHVFFFYDTATT